MKKKRTGGNHPYRPSLEERQERVLRELDAGQGIHPALLVPEVLDPLLDEGRIDAETHRFLLDQGQQERDPFPEKER